ncbi:MAG: hypothetical protein ACK518_02310 [bacterium]
MNFKFWKRRTDIDLNTDIDILHRENESLKRRIALLESSIINLLHTSTTLIENNEKLIEAIEKLKKQ